MLARRIGARYSPKVQLWGKSNNQPMVFWNRGGMGERLLFEYTRKLFQVRHKQNQFKNNEGKRRDHGVG
jgi:hypothetical protein